MIAQVIQYHNLRLSRPRSFEKEAFLKPNLGVWKLSSTEKSQCTWNSLTSCFMIFCMKKFALTWKTSCFFLQYFLFLFIYLFIFWGEPHFFSYSFLLMLGKKELLNRAFCIFLVETLSFNVPESNLNWESLWCSWLFIPSYISGKSLVLDSSDMDSEHLISQKWVEVWSLFL